MCTYFSINTTNEYHNTFCIVGKKDLKADRKYDLSHYISVYKNDTLFFLSPRFINAYNGLSHSAKYP